MTNILARCQWTIHRFCPMSRPLFSDPKGGAASPGNHRRGRRGEGYKPALGAALNSSALIERIVRSSMRTLPPLSGTCFS